MRDPDEQSLLGIDEAIYVTADEADVDAHLALGFSVHRRQGTYVVPTDAPRIMPPSGIAFVEADRVDERLRLLDDELRQDVPGSDGWRWDEAGFREETYESLQFDPPTYLVAVDEASGELVGIVRVWMRQPIPRLGFIGVRRDLRQRGIARALLGEVFSPLS